MVGDRLVACAVDRYRTISRPFSPARMRWTHHFQTNAAGKEPAGHHGADRHLESQLPRQHIDLDCALSPGSVSRFPAICNNWKWKATASACKMDGAPGRGCHLPDHLGRYRHQRPARILPDAASGNRHHTGRFHCGPQAVASSGKASGAPAGKLLCAIGSLHARQECRRSARRHAKAQNLPEDDIAR
jgi:hypothetical protein